MRFRVSVQGVLLLVCLIAAGCGAKKDKPSDDGGLPVDDSGYDAPPPSPGVCHRFCCGSGDCSPGETCTPLQPASGTLGVCMGGSTGDAGMQGDGGMQSDAGLDPSCWAQGPKCNPLTNASCPAGAVCDVTGLVDGSVPQVECLFGDNVQSAGQDCDSVNGPFCIPGYHCVSN